MDFLGLSNVFSIVIHVIKLMKKKWMRKIDGKIFFYHLYGAYLQYDVFQNMFWKAICCCNLVNMDFFRSVKCFFHFCLWHKANEKMSKEDWWEDILLLILCYRATVWSFQKPVMKCLRSVECFSHCWYSTNGKRMTEKEWWEDLQRSVDSLTYDLK